MTSQRERTGRARTALRLSTIWACALLFALWQAQAAFAQWVTSGTNISTTNTGNVGVGTSAPNAKLDVTFDGGETTGVKIFDTRSAGTGFGGHLLFHGYSSGRSTEVRFGQIGGLKENATYGNTLGFLGFYTNNGSGSLSMVEQMRINSSGNVGIGTTNPGNYKLNVFGPIQGMANYTTYTPDGLYSATARPSRILTNSGASILFGYEDWGYGDYSPRVGFQQTYDPIGSPYITTTKASIGLVRNGSITIKGGAGNNEFMRIDAAGNVGIGTTSPSSSRLHLYSPGHTYLRIGAPLASQSAIAFNDDSNGQDIVLYRPQDTRDFAMWTPTVGNAFRMTQDGRFGLGTDAPSYKLDVRGGQVNASGGLCINGDCKTAWSQVAGGTQWTTAGSSLHYGAGNVGIGTTAPAAKFHVYNGGGNPRTGISIDAQGAQSYQQAEINLYTLGDGTRDVVTAGTKGWHLAARGNAYAGAAEQNDLQLYSWDGTAIAIRQYWDSAGNVGIGTINPTAKLDVDGDINVRGNINAKYQDIAEWVPTSQKLSPGTVVVLDPAHSNHVLASSSAYDTGVAGVVSARPGLLLGESGEGKAMVATTGRVKVKVDATKGAIRIGDLLVTSDMEGVAMKSEPVVIANRRMHAPGTIIGKALEPLDKGVGEILVLLSMQ